MALESRQSPPGFNETKDPIFDDEKYSGNGSGDVDPEGGRRRKWANSDKPVGRRIAPVLPHLVGTDDGGSGSETDILTAQIEAESANSIKYRTCSWPKVCYSTFNIAQIN